MPYFKNERMNLLFIHIPKTGGTSVEHYFYGKYNFDMNETTLHSDYGNSIFSDPELKMVSLQHQTLQTLLDNKEILKINTHNLKILTIVRNPYDRTISDLFFFKLIEKDTLPNDVYNILCKYLKEKYYDNHNIEQYKFICNKEGKKYDKVIILKTESLNDDMRILGFPDFNETVNKNIHINNYSKYLNEESIKLINEFFDKDFELFGYEKKLISN